MISNAIEIYPSASRVGSCYTLLMQSETDWTQWAESLQNLKLDGLVAWLLDAGAPLTVLGAQLIYLTQPFFGGKNSMTIAHMLEEDKEAQAFAEFLRAERAA